MERQALEDHGRASITCLLSGFDAFTLSHTDQTTYIRVLKGLYGVMVYATEYWTEYLLSHAADLSITDDISDLLVVATELAQKLEQTVELATSEEFKSDSRSLDIRLELLSPHPVLQKQVRLACEARSLKRLESELHREDGQSCQRSRRS
jgi:hypothetical protein